MNIVILSRNKDLYSTQRLVEEGQRRNHQVEVIDPLNCDLIIEKEKPTVLYNDRYLDDVDAIIPRIGASVTYYGCAVVRQFEMMNVFSTVSSDAIIRSRDQLRSFQHLSKAGIDMPKTVFTNYSFDVEKVIAHVGGTPVVIKLLEGTQGIGVVLAETKNAAESVLEAFNGLVLVYGKHHPHVGGTYSYHKLSEEESKLALKAAQKLKLPICGVDILQSNRGPLIMEINSTPGLEGIEGASEKNIAQAIITYIERNRRL